MTIHEFPKPVPPSTAHRPARSGEPWTDDDYTTLVRMARDGASASEVGEMLQRSPSAILLRARRMLPLDQRGVPADRVVQHLGDLARADEDYPWATHLAATPPPRPVIEHIFPPARYSGIKGLEDHELVAIAAAFAWLRAGTADPQVASEVARTVRARELTPLLRRAMEGRGADLIADLLHDADRYDGPPWEATAWDERRWEEAGDRWSEPTWSGRGRDEHPVWAERPAPDTWQDEPPWDDEPPPAESEDAPHYG